MKISTNQFFDGASRQIVSAQNRLSEVQVQLASGKRINQASDEPDKAASLQRLRSLIAQQEGHLDNLGVVNERLQGQDAALSGANDLLQRLRELAIQYANGTLGADQRKIAAIEVRGVRAQLLTLANSLDSTGMALFAGTRVAGPAFGDNGVYAGDQTEPGAPVGSARLVDTRSAGDSVFVNIIRIGSGPNSDTAVGFFAVIDDLAQALETNDVAKARRGIDELNLIHQGVSLAQAQVGANLNVVSSQESILQEQLLQMQSLESDLQDVDYATAVSQMQKQILGLEAAQSSFAKISRLSLFEFI